MGEFEVRCLVGVKVWGCNDEYVSFDLVVVRK